MNEKTAMYEICILLHLILNKMWNFSKIDIFILYNKSKLIWKGDVDVNEYNNKQSRPDADDAWHENVFENEYTRQYKDLEDWKK